MTKTREVRTERLTPPNETTANIKAGKKKKTTLPLEPAFGNQATVAAAIRASQRAVGKKCPRSEAR